MASPSTIDEYLDLVRRSGVLDQKRLDAYLAKLRADGNLPPEPGKLAGFMVRDAILTHFQAEQFMLGKWRRFTIGKYKVLERLGSGGMGSVYLCEHKLMRRRAAVKVLPSAKSNDPAALERFFREARAVAALDHPNIVRAYDIDQEDNLHFLVMEYVDGASLQEIVKKSGPLSVDRAAHYIRQSALGLQHAHETAGLIHRDIKPGNILVDRGGTVKVLDMGLARFFHDEDDLLTKKYDENVLGTADYLAPEQALDSHAVDIRADIYSLGATFYFCLCGRTPFSEGSVAQKLIWHQTRQPKAVRSLRPEVPEKLAAVVERMMAKDPDQRYQTPDEVVLALGPWTRAVIAPPPDEEMPHLSPAAMGTSPTGNVGPRTPQVPASGPSSGRLRKVWQVPASPSPRPAAPPRVPSEPSAKTAAAEKPARAAAPVAKLVPSGGASATELTVADPEEESLPWEKLTSETLNPIAKADTPPIATLRGPSRRPDYVAALKQFARAQRPLTWVVMGISGAVLGALLGLAIWSFFGTDKPPPRKGAAPQAPAPLRVGKGFEYPTVAEALAKAQPGDRIVVMDGPIKEQVSVTGPKAVTLEAANVIITWQPPDRVEASLPLLQLHQAAGFQLKGKFILDGKGILKDLVAITGSSPGLKLRNVDLVGVKKSGIRVMNCQGALGDPVELNEITVRGGPVAEAALVFEVQPAVKPKVNQHINVSDWHVMGPFKASAPIQIVDPKVNQDLFFTNLMRDAKPWPFK